jgi:hypothetical protein
MGKGRRNVDREGAVRKDSGISSKWPLGWEKDYKGLQKVGILAVKDGNRRNLFESFG